MKKVSPETKPPAQDPQTEVVKDDGPKLQKALAWESMRREFIFGVYDEKGQRRFPSMTEIAQKYGCRVEQVSRVSTRGNRYCQGKWKEERAKAQKAIQGKLVEKRGNRIAETLAEIEARHFSLWHGVEIAATFLLFASDGNGHLLNPPRFASKLTVPEVKDLIASLKTATEIQRTVVGEPTWRGEFSEGPTRPAILDELSPDEIEDAARIYAIALTHDRKKALTRG